LQNRLEIVDDVQCEEEAKFCEIINYTNVEQATTSQFCSKNLEFDL